MEVMRVVANNTQNENFQGSLKTGHWPGPHEHCWLSSSLKFLIRCFKTILTKHFKMKGLPRQVKSSSNTQHHTRCVR